MKKNIIATFAMAALFAATTLHAAPLKDAKLDISGVAQLGYSWTETAGGNDQAGTNRMRLNLVAAPAEKIIFVSQLELTNNKSPNAFGNNVPGGALLSDAFGSDSPIVDMYLVLNYLEWGTLLVGQMPTPVSYELNIPEFGLETINYSQFVGIANRDRGVGLLVPLNKEFKTLVWALNGIGSITGATDDVDDRNNYGAMVQYDDPKVKLSMKGWVNIGDLMDVSGMFGAMGIPQVVGNKTELDVEAIGGGANYTTGPFHFMAEYALAKINIDDSTAGARLATAQTETWYLHGAYSIPKTGLQLVARYDEYNPNTKAGSAGETKIATGGLNWNFKENARLQIMREFKTGENDRLDAQLSLSF